MGQVLTTISCVAFISLIVYLKKTYVYIPRHHCALLDGGTEANGKVIHSGHHFIKWPMQRLTSVDWEYNGEDDDGNVILDYIGRFEDFKGSWKKISKKIGFKKPLPHVKATKKRQHYSKYYTDELRDIVADRFANDIEYFGYKFKDKR